MSLPAPSESTLPYGYDVTIERKEWYSLLDGGYEWKVTVVRISDGETIDHTFSWRRSAHRFARSTRRIGKAFEAAQRHRDAEVEKFTLGWTR